MHLCYKSTQWCAFLLIMLGLANCQRDGVTLSPGTTNASAYLFTDRGNPGILTDVRFDLDGQLSGTIGEVPVKFGLDQPVPLETRTGYLDREKGAPALLYFRAQDEQNNVTISLRGPFRVGSYTLIKLGTPTSGRESDQPLTGIAEVGPRYSILNNAYQFTPLRNKQLTIKAITPDCIEGEFSFTLDKPNAPPERLTFRIKNRLAENSNIKTTSTEAPFWSYEGVRRTVTVGYDPTDPRSGVFNEYGYPAETVKFLISHRPLPQGNSRFTYNGTTTTVAGQTSALLVPKIPTGRVRLELGMFDQQLTTDTRTVELDLPNFTGVGTYTSQNALIRFGQSVNYSNSWRVYTSQIKDPNTTWQVVVTRVTAEVIEGTYALNNAVPNDTKGSLPVPALVSLTGSFKVIYPR